MGKHILQQALEDLEYNTRSYSGRSMYKETCLAITGDLNQFRVGLEVAEYLKNENLSGPDTDIDDDLFEDMKNCREDSMGRGTVLYWPSIPFVDNEDNESDDES